MRHLTYGHTRSVSLLRTLWVLVAAAAARVTSPTARGPLLASLRKFWTRAGVGVLLGVGLVVQLVALLVLGYLIDLSISLMELWADLARKHLELTL